MNLSALVIENMQNVHKTVPNKSRKICSVPQCWTYCTADTYLHRFPFRDEKLCLQWKKILKIENPITRNMYVCSLHFHELDYFPETPLTIRRRLRRGVIPSLKLPSSRHQIIQPNTNKGISGKNFLKKNSVPSQNLPISSRKGINNTSCSVRGCRSKKEPSISFHAFPTAKSWVTLKNEFGVEEKVDRREAWLKKLKIGAQRSRRAVVCCLHFTEDDFILRDSQTLRRRLKSTAVPSLNLPKIGYEAQVDKINPSITSKKSRNRSRRTIPSRKLPVKSDTVKSRKAKIRSKKSSNDQNEGTEDIILFGPEVEEFKNDNKFELCYLDPEIEKVPTRKPSKTVTDTDDANESYEIDLVNNIFEKMEPGPLDTQCHQTKQVSSGFQHICRICSATNSLTHLKKCQALVALYVSITNIEINVEDNLPKYICADCIQKLEEISNFICGAKKNVRRLRRSMLANNEIQNDPSDNEDEESSSETEDISNVPQDEFSNDCADIDSLTTDLSVELNNPNLLGSDITSLKNIELLKDKSMQPLLKKDVRENNNIVHNTDDHENSSDNETSKQNVYFSDKKNDCTCWKCGEVYVGLRIPKIIEDLPPDRIKFHCLNCSTPNSRPFKSNVPPKVYPGKATNGKEKKIKCITCSENIPLSEFVTHQLQNHSLKKKYTCKLCFSSFSHPSFLKRHAKRHT